GARPLGCSAGAARVPDEPARFGRKATCHAHQLGGIRAEQDVAARGHAREDLLKSPPVTAVVFYQDVRGAAEGLPRFQPLCRLTAELRELAGQGEAGPDAQVTVHGVLPHIDLVAEPLPVTGSP